MVDPLSRRREERDQLIALARCYVERLAARLPVIGAAVVGSVARGDFNVWSDVDVVVLAESLPARLVDRLDLLTRDAPPGVQPAGFTPCELRAAVSRGNPLVMELRAQGVALAGADALSRATSAATV